MSFWALIPDAALRAEAGRQGAGDMLGLGLTARGTTFGALVVVRGPNRDFSAHDIAVAEILAARAAVPLDSARLYEERGRIATMGGVVALIYLVILILMIWR